MNISSTGYWINEQRQPHEFDAGLAEAIGKFMAQNQVQSVLDFGCGTGEYVDFLHNRGFWAVGYDGNPFTATFSPHCHVADLSSPVDFGLCDCVLSLETGEHIPSQFEKVFLDNLCLHAGKYAVVSWFPYQGEGIGHVNEKPNDYIKQKMLERRFVTMNDEETNLRAAATLWWFKVSLMVFRRV
jgi:methyltransferase family protein